MKKISFILLLLNGGVVFAQQEETKPISDKKIHGSFEVNYNKDYLWRGAVFGNTPVSQPNLELNYKNFTLGLCQNFNVTPKKLPKESYTKPVSFDEQDVEIRHAFSKGKFSFETSVFAYFYFSQIETPNTGEFNSYIEYSLYKNFSLFTENTVDIISYRGSLHSKNGVLYSTTFKNDIAFSGTVYTTYANARFNNTYFGADHAGFNLAGANIEIQKDIRQYFLKCSVEKNLYLHQSIIDASGSKGSYNYALAAGINF